MDKVHKSASAAQNVRSPLWETTSMRNEECGRRIRAICTYTGVPASLLPTKKELIEMRKQKDLEILNKEAEIQAALEKEKEVPPVPTTMQVDATADTQMNGAATKRKSPVPNADESFTVVKAKKDKRVKINKNITKTPMPPKPKTNNMTRTQPTFTSRPVNDSRAYSEVLRKANEGKQVSHVPHPIIAQEEPLPRANPNRPAPRRLKELFTILNVRCRRYFSV
ncbi:hypothetical protein CDAR_279151 [Caerostris darwini]|uniref:Uncharacterized protein n=1 Tax=Caerostris darwini TaxID=1538125 RepID=A0AAV4T342_9ARAC|nr:hypothetical protein CDAR_279151 [Caerostris darwini]